MFLKVQTTANISDIHIQHIFLKRAGWDRKPEERPKKDINEFYQTLEELITKILHKHFQKGQGEHILTHSISQYLPDTPTKDITGKNYRPIYVMKKFSKKKKIPANQIQ